MNKYQLRIFNQTKAEFDNSAVAALELPLLIYDMTLFLLAAKCS